MEEQFLNNTGLMYFMLTGSPIQICFLLMCLSTLQCLIGDNSMQLG